jgi:PncC family amidohydrolase
MKSELLGVSPETLVQFGAVSREAAEAMAAGALRRTGAAYALSVTGVAGPDALAGPGGKPVAAGTVWVGLAGPAGASATHRVFLGDRQRIRILATHMALDLLRRLLLGLP